MGLEIPTGKTPGTEVRRTPAPRNAFAGLLILGLIACEFIFMTLVMWVVFGGKKLSAAGHDPAIPQGSFSIFGFKTVPFFTSEQTIVSFWLACIFFCLFMIILLYQRFFMDHVTVVKRRFRKWEDEGVQLR